ncbi:hypothetical protein SCLCIDRAFT_1215193 [Scleroderma citrinum Foug A]|uniref:Uncharacterized protein n=1 Tax=Scleroderma citrinum Foug A TaxID=1036808 RepID=A0A0C3ABN3_9AGAM|nr:hypothetical protein SCLCIDRAFT_1215193 [Scleroderma citrinum Foug A]
MRFTSMVEDELSGEPGTSVGGSSTSSLSSSDSTAALSIAPNIDADHAPSGSSYSKYSFSLKNTR